MVKNKLILKDAEMWEFAPWKTLMNTIPCLLSIFCWIGLMIIGFNAIEESFIETEWYPVVVIIWLLVMMKFTKLVTIPKSVYHIKHTDSKVKEED